MAGTNDLRRRATAEAVGTAMLVAVVVGSGIMADQLSHDTAVVLLANSIATAFGLMAIIFLFQPISGAHLNPVVTLVDRLEGGVDTRATGAYVAAQVVGGCVGCVVANLMFELPAVELSTHARSSSGLWFGEIVATFGLVALVFGMVRTRRTTLIPFAVGAYIGAGYWFTSSTSFANPAVTVARTLTNTFTGIAPSSAPMFIVAEIAGALLALVLVRFLHPTPVTTTDDPLHVPEPDGPGAPDGPGRSDVPSIDV